MESLTALDQLLKHMIELTDTYLSSNSAFIIPIVAGLLGAIVLKFLR